MMKKPYTISSFNWQKDIKDSIQGWIRNGYVSSENLHVKKCRPPWLADGESF